MGNVLLKTVEGTAKFMAHEIKKVFTASAGTKIGYLLCKKGMDDFREMFNQDKVGGAPFLGIAKPVIKAPRDRLHEVRHDRRGQGKYSVHDG